MITITLRVLGQKHTVDVAQGSTYNEIADAFQSQKNVNLRSMDVFSRGRKITNFDEEVSESTDLTAVKSKHESAA